VPNKLYHHNTLFINKVKFSSGTGLLTCVISAAQSDDIWGIVGGSIYGISLIFLFSASSIYHGLVAEFPKKILRIIDHCAIYILIAGTYTPVLLGKFRVHYPADAWTIFAVIWIFAFVGITLKLIDIKRFQVFSIICYLGMGWAAIFRARLFIELFGVSFFVLLLISGVVYSVGALLYVVGKRNEKKYMHSVFHLFVDAAALLQFIAIVIFVI
jgi:hemolysin III